MNLVVFGASGRTGCHIVEQALAGGHTVTAFVRSGAKMHLQHERLRVVEGEVLDAAAVQKAVAGQQAVISALGPTRPPVENMMADAARSLTAAMSAHGVRRLISTTGAGVRHPNDQPKPVDRLMKTLLTLLAGGVLRDSEENVKIIQSSDLDWTIVRFPRLTDGPLTGSYRVGYLGRDSGTQLSRRDAAHFVLKELEEPRFIRQMPVVSY